VGEVGNALRIYTVHEAKGLEAPIVWLLDANDTQGKTDSYSVLLDWQPNAPQPAHFSLFSDKRGRGAKRAPYFDADEAYAQREEMNLLYVAMTRAKQALLVSGNGEPAETSWYGRIAHAVKLDVNPLLVAGGSVVPAPENPPMIVDAALLCPFPTGKRALRITPEQQRGTWLHALLQHLTPPNVAADKAVLQAQCGIPAGEMDTLWQQARALLQHDSLQRFFDPQHYLSASNEMPYVNAAGELRRIDRLVEYDDEVWVLDYKTGEAADPAPYRAQMAEYRSAMQSVYAGKKIRCALLFSGGVLSEV
jgi:ATP-dependent helicase/nuclease subunit A